MRMSWGKHSNESSAPAPEPQASCDRGAASDESEEETERYPACAECGRRYPHQHVRSVNYSLYHNDDSDSEQP